MDDTYASASENEKRTQDSLRKLVQASKNLEDAIKQAEPVSIDDIIEVISMKSKEMGNYSKNPYPFNKDYKNKYWSDQIVKIYGVPESVTTEQVRDFFLKVGVSVARVKAGNVDEKNHTRVVSIFFQSFEDLKKSYSLNGQLLGETTIILSRKHNQLKVFQITGLETLPIDQDHVVVTKLKEKFEPYGRVGKIFLPRDENTGLLKGLAYFSIKLLPNQKVPNIIEDVTKGETFVVESIQPTSVLEAEL